MYLPENIHKPFILILCYPRTNLAKLWYHLAGMLRFNEIIGPAFLTQALEKLRGKNGDKKITAKDGFCMQKWLAKDWGQRKRWTYGVQMYMCLAPKYPSILFTYVYNVYIGNNNLRSGVGRCVRDLTSPYLFFFEISRYYRKQTDGLKFGNSIPHHVIT